MSSILPPFPWDRPPTSFEVVDWYVKLRQTINESALDHNSLLNLQGGAVGDYNHLTTAQVALVTGAEQTSNKNANSGYAGLNSSGRTTKGVDTTDDIIIDLATKGIVFKDTQGTPHYWRLTVDNTGTLVTTDLGTTKP